MPYNIEYKKGKGYKLHLKNDSKRVFSKKYMPKKKVIKQMQAIEISKRKKSDITGGSIIDKIKNTISKITNLPFNLASAIIPETTRYTTKTDKMLKRYGHFEILTLTIEKQPVDSSVMKLANVLTALELQSIMQKNGIDKFYHLSLKADIITATNKPLSIIIEKNENINVDIYKQRPNTEFFPIDLKGQKLTISSLLTKTRLNIGDEHFFLYRWDNWNCADFILEILKSNNLYTMQAHDFIYQNAELVKRNMSSSSSNRLHFITKLGSLLKKMQGGNIDVRFI